MQTEISNASLAKANEQLSAHTKQAKSVLLENLQKVDFTDIAKAREDVIRILDACCNELSTRAEEVGCDLYSTIREAAGIKEPYEPLILDVYHPTATRGKVHNVIRHMKKPKRKMDEEQLQQYYARHYEIFTDSLTAFLDKVGRRSLHESVIRNSVKDKHAKRYARVPTGRETCPFCLMLASRGFVYHTEHTASHAHAHCDCVVVPGFKDTVIEGYDPDALYKVWKALDDIGNDETLTKEEKRLKQAQVMFKYNDPKLTPEERRERMHEIFKLATKDKKLVQESVIAIGKPLNPFIVTDENELRDQPIYNKMASLGYKLVSNSVDGKKTEDNRKHIDAYINGLCYEFKSPDKADVEHTYKNELRFIERNIHNLANKYMDCVDEHNDGLSRGALNLTYRDLISDRERILNNVRYHVEECKIYELYLLEKDGTFTRFKWE